MFIANNGSLSCHKFLHFVYLSHSLASMMYKTEHPTYDQVVDCSFAVWDTTPLWDKDYVCPNCTDGTHKWTYTGPSIGYCHCTCGCPEKKHEAAR